MTALTSLNLSQPLWKLPEQIGESILSFLSSSQVGCQVSLIARGSLSSSSRSDEAMWRRRIIQQFGAERATMLKEIYCDTWKTACLAVSRLQHVRLVHPDKRIEEGKFSKGELNNGKITYSDGTIEEGYFEHGLLLAGTITSPDGSQIKRTSEGFKHGVLTRIIHLDGRIEVKELKKDCRLEGKETIICTDTRIRRI